MSSNISITISGMTRTADSKAIYVLFTDGEKNAEIAIPGSRLIANNGFSEEEIAEFMEYVISEKDSIYELARTINPIRAMMK